MSTCEACKGRGWQAVMVSGMAQIQACRDCQTFPTDEAAYEAVRAAIKAVGPKR